MNSTVYFAPVLYSNNVAGAIAFYQQAFNAKELRRWSNEDGSVHVAEMKIDDAIFHLHEEVKGKNELSPATPGGTCVVLGLFVANPGEVAAQAIAAGATMVSPVQDYDYGYRQGDITDPFGHHWTIQKVFEQIQNRAFAALMFISNILRIVSAFAQSFVSSCSYSFGFIPVRIKSI